MDRITYNDMVQRFGKNRARDLLICMERLGIIRAEIIDMDFDKRLEKALLALNDNSVA